MNPVTRAWNKIPKIPYFWDSGGNFWIIIVGGISAISIIVAKYLIFGMILGNRLFDPIAILIGGVSGTVVVWAMETWRVPEYRKDHKEILWMLLLLGLITGSAVAFATNILLTFD